MPKKISRFFFYYLPPFLWMLFIFALSSRTSIGVTHELVYDFIIFKTLHMIQYGILFFLLYRALHQGSSMNKQHALKLAFILAVIYGASDELHQQFVPTREGRLRDVLIDTVGISVVYWNLRNVKRRM